MLTTEETATRLEVTPARVRQMIIAGRLPAQRFGRSHMILESDLALVAGRTAGRPPKVKAEAGPVGLKPKRATKKGGKK